MESYVTVGYDFNPNEDHGSFHIMDVSFGFELTEEVRKKHKDNEYTTEFFMSLFPKNSFNRKTGERIEYKDQADLPLETQLRKMIYDMFVIANQLRCVDILDEREYEKQQEERKPNMFIGFGRFFYACGSLVI